MSTMVVVFFSVKGEAYYPDGLRMMEKGNTQLIAEKLSAKLDCDCFEIVPKTKYPSGYRGQMARAQLELGSNERPDIEPLNIDADIIFLLYPNWIETIPMPVATFLESQGWEGKTIHPLCTNDGRGLGRSVDSIRMMAIEADVSDGLGVLGYEADLCDGQLDQWIDGLGLS